MQEKSKENHTTASGSYRFGDFALQPSERQLWRGATAIRLQPKVFDALLLFVRNAGRLVRRDDVIEALWPDTFVTDANLTNVIVALRKTLGAGAIQTVSKFGYRFTIPVLGEPGIDQATYETFLRAKALVETKSLEAMKQAQELFAVCVAADPSFAAAWAWLGRAARFLDKFKHDTPTNLDLARAAFRRALAIDPHLACAHHFYTQLQVDLGESREAMVRLGRHIVERGDEPESYAGLVHALRYCGLLDESIAAHERATALDPAIVTSVPHTHFLRGDYGAALDAGPTRYYLDAAALAALGEHARATTALTARLAAQTLSPLMTGLMGSLLAILEHRPSDAAAIMKRAGVRQEPETIFYFARHYSMLGDCREAIEMLRRARREGFTSATALRHDAAFEALREDAVFREECAEAERMERDARRALQATGLRLAAV
jgi:DNA-binding winged helix-turn-helix (wHTH) protein/Tfp pilus assembly protein PilF